MAKKDYSKLSKEELIVLVEKLESRKKYGLVWDEERTKEKFEKESENALPVLKEVKSREIKTDPTKPTNILIEGDNYHALSVLNYTHQGKIDVIYIDPPYNTGNKDFKYNDNYVDKEDAYRHSKWLSFMSKRLRLAKNLLKDDGVIFINIDHNEHANLKLLCDDIFGEQNFQREIIWRIGWLSGFKTLAPNFIRNHDTILMYSKNYLLFEFNKEYIENSEFKPLLKFNKKVGEKLSALGLNKNQQKELLRFINYENRPKRYPLEDTWNCNEYDDLNSIAIVSFSGEKVSKYLETEEFDGQKPVKLIKRILKSRKEKSSLVLDFFAGSGTTGHATLELNKEDGGNRTFILCTNDENEICTKFCYPRIKKVTKEGLGGNLKYFKTAFVKNSISRDDLKLRITRECTEMLCLREGIFDEVKTTSDYRIFAQNGRVMGVYYSLEREALASLKKELDKIEGEKILYCFTLDPLGLDKADFAVWQGVSLEPIPQKILDIYEQIYEY